MKRDMDLIRVILHQAENHDLPNWYSVPFTVEGYEALVVAKHVELLVEAGLIKARFLRTDQAGLQAAYVERLTWAGCEFIEATRDESVYRKAKEVTVAKTGGLVFEILKDVLLSLAKAAIKI